MSLINRSIFNSNIYKQKLLKLQYLNDYIVDVIVGRIDLRFIKVQNFSSKKVIIQYCGNTLIYMCKQFVSVKAQFVYEVLYGVHKSIGSSNCYYCLLVLFY